MPLYEYQCDACAHRFELIQKFSDPPPASCPECGGAVRKLVSSPAIQFKGTGWYVTDYARQDRKEAPDAAESKADAASDGAASKPDKDKKPDKKDAKKTADSGSDAAGSSSKKTAGPASTGAGSSS